MSQRYGFDIYICTKGGCFNVLSQFFPVVVVSLIFPVVKNMNEVRSGVWSVGLGCQLNMKDGLRLRLCPVTNFVPE